MADRIGPLVLPTAVLLDLFAVAGVYQERLLPPMLALTLTILTLPSMYLFF